MCPGMWKTSSSYCRFEDVQLEDDDLETQFVAGVSAYPRNSSQVVRYNSLSLSFVDTVELNCDNDNEWSDNDNDSESDESEFDKENKLRSKRVRKTKRKQRQKNKTFKELVAQERANEEEVSNPPLKEEVAYCQTTI